VEEQFYWLWPLLLYVTPSKYLKYLIFILASVGVCGWIYLFYFADSPDSGRLTLAALPCLMGGATCAMLVREQRCSCALKRFSRFYLPVAIVAFLAYGLFKDIHYLAIFLAALGALVISFSSCLLAALFGPRIVSHAFEFKPLRLAGRYSYGMYVYHIPLFTIIKYYLPNLMMRRGILFTACFVLAALSYELVEKRIIAFKVHFRAQFRELPDASAEP
jgi:peptidoglycan/LPS O-acetylase OafA/YrhL